MYILYVYHIYIYHKETTFTFVARKKLLFKTIVTTALRNEHFRGSHLTNFLSAYYMPATALATGVIIMNKTDKNFLPSWNLHPSSRDTISKLICKLNKQLTVLSATEKNKSQESGQWVCMWKMQFYTKGQWRVSLRRHLLTDWKMGEKTVVINGEREFQAGERQ